MKAATDHQDSADSELVSRILVVVRFCGPNMAYDRQSQTCRRVIREGDDQSWHNSGRQFEFD